MSEGTADLPTAPATPAGPTAVAMAAVSASAGNIASPDADAAGDDGDDGSGDGGGGGGDGGEGSLAPDVDMQDSSLVAITATPTTPSSTPQKERHSLTLDQRRALRRWANTQPSRPSHKQCIEWFHREYQQTISQSTVSHSLSPKYARLDGEPQLSGSRLRFGNWPEVEKLVLLWYQQMTNTGRHPTNEELADKAKNIFTQLPRHRGEEPPEFSPGWIHRFKKRYGLLIRRQRRQSALGTDPSAAAANGDPAADVAYLVDTVPSLMDIAADTNPALIRGTIQRTLGIEPSIAVCTRVRDEIVHYAMIATTPAASAPAGTSAGGGGPPGLASATTTSEASAATAAAAAVAAAAAAAVSAASADFGVSRGNSHDPQQQQQQQQGSGAVILGTNHQPNGNGNASTDTGPGSSSVYPSPDDDPEMVLQNALRQLQQQEEVEVAEAAAAAAAAAAATVAAAAGTAADAADDIRRRAELGVPATPLKGGASANAAGNTSASSAAAAAADQPRRCPFCVNQRMLRTINEAVDHMASHVVVE